MQLSAAQAPRIRCFRRLTCAPKHMILRLAARSGARWAAVTSTVALHRPDAPARCDGLPFKLPTSVEELVPFGQTVSVGGLMGVCSGFALKKVGKLAAGLFGGLFCLQQALAYQGYVTVNWSKVEKDLTEVLDVNKDGKLDAGDVNEGYTKVLKVLQSNTAGLSGGFAGGFLLGVRLG
ncbi:unnamed protein product [Durusdinium trenchii]|uniref:Uncharacterized protein n=1 Tax=Durusdinium trenchii TaxID=1381693 RepID=A0ABP0LWM9_9DINO